jgi:hypothetical protein
VSETVEDTRSWIFSGGQDGEHNLEIAVGVTLGSAEDAFAILPQDTKIIIRIFAERVGGIQLPDPSSSGRRLQAKKMSTI